ncbi:acVLRF1 family peptidyl-tRNA hydrolase [Quadrisphaera setariae]|uniref:acVLRF1 family peptidyl-tRNA hydrolase n=1 Tax=Quadrisphaera setariae TaxID=2593304 RepID=UPI001C9BC8A2|nr:acVLRF1 family peptidyl-tRNA hydrolase [Quadrisphaera setariae]
MTSRLVEVAPERLAGWVARFTASHGPVRHELATPEHLLLRAADGEVADLEVPWPPLPVPLALPTCSAEAPEDDDVGERVAALAAHAALERTALLVLARRGGWAVGLARGGELLDGTHGTRYVQSRTAAGGWSQQRYARRRANQADGLVAAARDGLGGVLGRATAGAGGLAPEVLVLGGDRQLVAAVVDSVPDPGAPRLHALPRGPLLDVPDPRRAVLVEVARRARCVRVRVGAEPAPAGALRPGPSGPGRVRP